MLNTAVRDGVLTRRFVVAASGTRERRLVTAACGGCSCGSTLRRKLAAAACGGGSTTPCGGGSRGVGLRRRPDIMACAGCWWWRWLTAACSGCSYGGTLRRKLAAAACGGSSHSNTLQWRFTRSRLAAAASHDGLRWLLVAASAYDGFQRQERTGTVRSFSLQPLCQKKLRWGE